MTGQGFSIVVEGDMGERLRAAALTAWRAPESVMTVAAATTDLPLAAGLEGSAAARRIFAPGARIYDNAGEGGRPLLWAPAARAGIDMVRGAARTMAGEIGVADARCFTVFSAPAAAPLPGALLNLAAAPVFGAPDAEGWASSAPDLRVQRMEDWPDRIDMREAGGRRLYLVFKTFADQARVFDGTGAWF